LRHTVSEGHGRAPVLLGSTSRGDTPGLVSTTGSNIIRLITSLAGDGTGSTKGGISTGGSGEFGGNQRRAEIGDQLALRGGIPVTIGLAGGGGSEPVAIRAGRGTDGTKRPSVTAGGRVANGESGAEIGNQSARRGGVPGTDGGGGGGTSIRGGGFVTGVTLGSAGTANVGSGAVHTVINDRGGTVLVNL